MLDLSGLGGWPSIQGESEPEGKVHQVQQVQEAIVRQYAAVFTLPDYILQISIFRSETYSMIHISGRT